MLSEYKSLSYLKVTKILFSVYLTTMIETDVSEVFFPSVVNVLNLE